MWKNKRIIAVIPARGGSKGIPRKNLQLLGGKPLISWSIDFALMNQEIDYVLVSTDDAEIASVSSQLGAEVPFLRPAALAEDASRTDDTVRHSLIELEKLGEVFDIVVLLQPTQPFRIRTDLIKALERFDSCNQCGVVSVSEVHEHPLLMRKISGDGSVQKLLDLDSTVRRQDFPAVYKVNGSLYINKCSDYYTSGSLSLNDNPYAVILPQKRSIDIDTWEDLDFSNYKLNQDPSFFID